MGACGSGRTGRFYSARYVFGAVDPETGGRAPPRVLRAGVRASLADEDWHEVSIRRPTVDHHILRVDDAARSDQLPGAGALRLGADDRWTRLYIGGVPDNMYDAGTILTTTSRGPIYKISYDLSYD